MLLTIIVSPLNVRLHAGPPARVEDERPGAISAIALASRLHVGLAGSAGVCWPDCSAFDGARYSHEVHHAARQKGNARRRYLRQGLFQQERLPPTKAADL